MVLRCTIDYAHMCVVTAEMAARYLYAAHYTPFIISLAFHLASLGPSVGGLGAVHVCWQY